MGPCEGHPSVGAGRGALHLVWHASVQGRRQNRGRRRSTARTRRCRPRTAPVPRPRTDTNPAARPTGPAQSPGHGARTPIQTAAHQGFDPPWIDTYLRLRLQSRRGSRGSRDRDITVLPSCWPSLHVEGEPAGFVCFERGPHTHVIRQARCVAVRVYHPTLLGTVTR